MNKVTNWVRTQVGRKSIPVGYKESLVAKSGLFSEEFVLRSVYLRIMELIRRFLNQLFMLIVSVW